MAPFAETSTWQTFLSQHQSIVSLLDTHTALLADMRGYCSESNNASSIIQERLSSTEQLLASIKESVKSLSMIRQNEQSGTNPENDTAPPGDMSEKSPNETNTNAFKSGKSEPHRAPAPVTDSSGLFTIDLNPTPIEELMKKMPMRNDKPAVQRDKRNNPDPTPLDDAPLGVGEMGPPGKKRRTEGEDIGGDAEDDILFDKRVEARIDAKDGKKNANKNKKRKRESDGSTGIDAVNETNPRGTNAKRKKPKHKHEPKYTKKRTNGQTRNSPNKKQKKSKS